LNPVGDQALFYRLDDRYRSPNACLKTDVDSLLNGILKNLVAMGRQQRLVGGDYMLAPAKGIENKCQGGLITAHEFNDDVDTRITEYVTCVGCEEVMIDSDTSRSFDIDIGNPLQTDLGTDPFGNEISVIPEEFYDPRTDGTETERPMDILFISSRSLFSYALPTKLP